MARTQGAGVALLLVLLGAVLPGTVSAKVPLEELLPTPQEVAPYRLNETGHQAVPGGLLLRAACDNATPVEGVEQRLSPQLLPGAVVKNKTQARITLYMFDARTNASRFVECLARIINETAEFFQRAVAYGDRGYVAELSLGAPRGASILFQKGALVVSVDALDADVESGTIQALARTIEGKLNATAAPARSPGFEAVAGLGALGAAAAVLSRRAR